MLTRLASDINALILDYLTMEGYPQAAANFSKEANIGPQDDADFIQARWEVRQYIHGGKFEAAIEALNELDPEVCQPNGLSDSPSFFPLPYYMMIITRVIHAPLIGPRVLDDKHHLYMIMLHKFHLFFMKC